MYDREYGRRSGRSDDRVGEEAYGRREREPRSDRETGGYGYERRPPWRRGFDRDDERMEGGYEQEQGGYGQEQGGYGRGGSRPGQLYYGRFEGIGSRGRYSGAFVGFRGLGPRGYRRSDERIRDDACECLTEHPGIDARQMEVRVDDGVVTLSGTVDDRRQKRLAEDALDDVAGVHDVENRLRVRRGASDDNSTGTEDRGRAGTQAASGGIWAFRDDSWRRNDLRGFDVEALDGRIGKVDDHTEPGADTLVVDTGPWIFGRHVLLPAGLVEGVDLDAQTVFVDRMKDEIKDAPEYTPEQGSSGALRREVGEYYASRGRRAQPREEQRA